MSLAFRGWTILPIAPAAALVAQSVPLFLLGALFGKLIDDSGSVRAMADLMTRQVIRIASLSTDSM